MGTADRVIQLVERGHTLRASLAACGWLAEDWARACSDDPDLGRRALLARGAADFRAEIALLASVAEGGQTGAKALEEILARRRLDLPIGRAEERSPLDRLLSDRAALDSLSPEDRATLDAGLAALEAVEGLAARLVGKA